MNVYVRELGSALAQAGVETTTFTRSHRPGLPDEIVVEPGHRVVHIDAGPHHLPKEALSEVTDEFRRGVLDWFARNERPDVIHGNYWLSGVVGHRLKHELDVPFVSTFHTLARVKAAHGDPEPLWRDRAEAEIVHCADAICVSCEEEADQFRLHYGDPQGRLEIIAPGVEHAFFAPGRPGGRPTCARVRRRQPAAAVRRTHPAAQGARCRDPCAGGVGRSTGATRHRRRCERLRGRCRDVRAHALVDELGLHDRVQFVEPQPHHILSTYYRAADVVIAPSRSESFGLVALEAAACGIPVVASAVGGLLSLVDDGLTGRLIIGRDPDDYAAAISEILRDDALRTRMSVAAVERARRYTWSFAAARLRRLYGDLTVRELVNCR
jgi:D-inositol-3-phosphate glycosyltransferase